LARLLDAADATQDDPQSILYQHTMFCQTGLPYRNPGNDVLVWEKLNGGVHLKIRAGMRCTPRNGSWCKSVCPMVRSPA